MEQKDKYSLNEVDTGCGMHPIDWANTWITGIVVGGLIAIGLNHYLDNDSKSRSEASIARGRQLNLQYCPDNSKNREDSSYCVERFTPKTKGTSDCVEICTTEMIKGLETKLFQFFN